MKRFLVASLILLLFALPCFGQRDLNARILKVSRWAEFWGRVYSKAVFSFTDGDTTPSVNVGNIFKTGNTGATVITMFDNGITGQPITVIIGDANTTFDFTGTNLKGNDGVDWTPNANDVLRATFDGTDWFCEAGGGGSGSGGLTIALSDFSFKGDGTENGVVLHNEADPTNRRNFNRTTGISDTQDMDWYGEKAVSLNPASLTLWTRASDYTNCTMTMQVWDQAGNADATGAVAITPTGNDTWEEFTYTLTSAYTSGEEIYIKIAITGIDTADTIDFGRVKINY